MGYMSNRSKKSGFPYFKNYIFSSLSPRSARETVTKGKPKKKNEGQCIIQSEVLALANWTATLSSGLFSTSSSERGRFVKNDTLGMHI